MNLLTSSQRSPAQPPLLVAFVPKGAKIALPASVTIPPAFTKSFSAKKNTLDHTWTSSGPAERVLLVGLGDRNEIDSESIRHAAALAVKAAHKLKVHSLTVWTGSALAKLPSGPFWTGRSLAEGLILGNYHFHGKKTGKPPHRIAFATLASQDPTLRSGAEKGAITAAACSFARDLQNHAANVITPSALADEALRISQKSDRISCQVLDESAMDELGMGLILAVSQGSVEPARFIHLTYSPSAKPTRKIALVGKGLTFDSGGISIKPAAKMEDMRFDMSGAAAVLGTFHALAQIDLPHEIHGIIPASENLLGAAAVKPGDIHSAMDGTSVEIINTDAEGRLILADALCYVADKIKPDTIIDLATLTGAVIHALGHELTAMFPRSRSLRDSLTAAGQITGEPVWELPLLDVHRSAMKSRSGADLANLSEPGIGAGTITGAAFLDHFVPKKFDWCHLDIAGTAWGAKDRAWVGGPLGTGVGPRLLLEFLESL